MDADHRMPGRIADNWSPSSRKSWMKGSPRTSEGDHAAKGRRIRMSFDGYASGIIIHPTL